MSHGLTSSDSMFSVAADRRPPWHGLGVVLERPPGSLHEALAVSGLDWRVVQHPLTLADEHHTPLPGYRANVRSDTGQLLGIVSDDYTVVDNEQAFGFLASLIGTELRFETAGSLWGGRQVFVTAELPDHIEVGGDQVRRFVLVSTWHTGTGAVRAAVTPIRVVCNNTLRAALDGAPSVYRVAHLGDPTAQLHEARRVLGMTVDYYRQFAALGDRLAGEQMTERALRAVLARLYPDGTDLGGRALANRQRAREAVLALFSGGETVGNAPGSKWAAWNAVCEWQDHHGARPRTDEGAFLRRTEDPHGVKARALELIAAR